jgi:hypothetical protein
MAARDFFVSFTSADAAHAAWITKALETAGYSTWTMSEDSTPGVNFILEMHRALDGCRRLLLTLSDDSLRSKFVQLEWASVLAKDPTGGRLFPVRVRKCDPGGLLRAVVYCDLVGLARPAARTKLLAAVASLDRAHERRRRPRAARKGRNPQTSEPVRFAASRNAPPPLPRGAKAVRALLDLLATTRSAFDAQVDLRDALVRQVAGRLGRALDTGFEAFFELHFAEMTASEREVHARIRGYTSDVLARCNRRALRILRGNAALVRQVPRLEALRRHLEVWLEKYEGVFAASPWVCVLYVGVGTDAVPFPAGVERDLERRVAR